jgi:phenylacetate-CoA ligase
MSEPNLEHYYGALTKIQPEELIGYPSSLFILSKYIKRRNLKAFRPKAIFTTAETLLEHQRALIEDVFEQMVVDQYGCTEMALFVSQCEKGTYHVHPEHGIVEVLDEHGDPVAPGEEGEAVCTGFVNYAMPVVRYRLGDRLALSDEQCPCGRHFPVIKQIIGRVDDILTTPDGRPLGRLDPVFKGMSGINETQIVQTDPDRLVFRITADHNFSAKNQAELLYEARKRTGGLMRIDIELVNEIPKDRNGKFRSVISQVEKTLELSRAD